MYEDVNEVAKYESLLNDKDYKNRQYFCRVVGAFVTYERRNDMIYIHKAGKIRKRPSFFGKKIKIEQAEQPYQYTWENMAFTKKRRCMGFMCSMLLLFLFLFIAFTIQFKMQKTVAYFDNYEVADCSIYKDSMAIAHDKTVDTPSIFIIPDFTEVRYQREAYATWKNFYENDDDADMT